MKGYPRWFSVRFVVLVMMLVFVTGALLIPTALEMRVDIEVPWRLKGAQQVIGTAVHVAAGGFSLLLLGALWSFHMRQGWQKKLRRMSGILLTGFFGVLSASALSILYSGNETALSISSFVHMAGGGVVGLFFVAHALPKPRIFAPRPPSTTGSR